MKNITKNINRMFMLGLFASLSLGFSQLAAAATSGQATIHNAVTVAYTSGTANLTTTATVDVTVSTVASAPNVVAPAAVTIAAGATTNLTYTVTSTANGPDTYTPTVPVTADAGVSADTVGITGSPLNLWGGIALGSGVDTITVPAGSENGITAGTTIVSVGGNEYTVTGIAGVGGAAIAAATTDAAGVTTAEVSAVLTLAPLVVGTNITAGSVAAATQVGEVGTFTVDITAGTPSAAGTDGTHTVPVVSVVTTATIADNATSATGTSASTVVVTVSSPSLGIVKKSRNVTNPSAFATTGTAAKPGEVIEYEITVTNGHATALASAVSITDSIPVYTAILNGQYATNDVSVATSVGGVVTTVTATAAGADDVATVAAGVLTVNLGAGATSAVGGTIAAGDSVVILYQITVQ